MINSTSSVPLKKLLISEIFEKYYLQRLDGKEKGNIYEGDVERITHGVMHASRVAGLINIFVNMLRECGSTVAESLTEEDVLYLQIAGLFHDAARKGEGRDTWDAESGEKCMQFLESIGLNQEKAFYFSHIIVKKEIHSMSDPKLTLLRNILQSADSLDIMRCKKKFKLDEVSLFEEFANLGHYDDILTLAVNHLHLIADQQDLQQDCEIRLGDKVIYSLPATMADQYVSKVDPSSDERGISYSDDKKAGYEHASDCFDKVMADFNDYQFMQRYCQFAPSLNQHVDYQKTALQEHRESIRNNAPKIKLNNDFVVKALRDGSIFNEYLDGLLSGEHTHALRTIDKKKYIVNGAGVLLREAKQPQYTAKEKQGFTSKQSVSIGTPSFHTPVFNFGNAYQHLTGMLFTDMNNVLLSNYLGLHDSGTTGRLNEFDDKNEAEMFAIRAKYRMFSKDHYPELKKAIEDPKTYQDSGPVYNESLVRLHFSADGSCKLFIARDTLESRLIVQSQAKILKKRLLQMNMCSDDFEVPICYYMPDEPSLHLRVYTKEEQELDAGLAQQYLSNPTIKTIKDETLDYMLMFGLTKEQFTHDFNNQKLFEMMGMSPFLYRSFEEMGYVSKDNLEDIFEEMMQLVKDNLKDLMLEVISNAPPSRLKLVFLQLVFMLSTLIEENQKDYFDTLISVLLKHKDICKLNQLIFKLDFSLLTAAVSHPEDTHYFKRLLDIGCAVDCVDKDATANTLLINAARASNVKAVDLLLDNNVNVNAVNKLGMSALHYAAAQKEDSVLKRLLSVPGIDLDAKDKKGKTPLVYALENDRMTHVDMLLKALPQGFDLDSITEDGDSLMMVALKKRSLAVLSHFQKNVNNYKININHQNNSGNTFFHELVSLKDVPVEVLKNFFTLFFVYFPNLNIKNKDGLTPGELASKINPELGRAFQEAITEFNELVKKYIDKSKQQPGAGGDVVDNHDEDNRSSMRP